MELRRLKYMSVLAEELHFGRAAERLGIAQPALTQQIRALERELDVELFHRTKRSVKLTVAGRVTLNEAIRTLQQAEKTALVARQAGRGELGHIEIGYVGSAIFTGVLSKAIARFRVGNPLVEFRLNEVGIVQQLDDVSSGRLDLGILRLPVKSVPTGVGIMSLHREPIILAIPRGHRLARQKSVTLSALKSEPFVAVQIQEGSGFNAQVAQICAAGGLSPQIAQRAGQFTALAGLVAGGLGVAFVPDSLRKLRIDDVVYRPLAKINQQSDLAMVYRKSERAPAVVAFLDQLRKLARPSP
ncbi:MULTISPECIES: LysR substrate-binding domain-containing protein [unclassified Bradyrhizobium]|uniref:LysR substrate-binding domain-containing protein n=1 Tax=unclassified Bradyrhizobium TaxID=2631580 RepID=UPI001FF64594|nr:MULTISPECIES: LysR substrate-binding domain-containing protein [unclassified Bradyrhizobium]MCJ9699900.1 LysR substrate-binding domain-containing protein [Bradyrhizobium sp. SHOUNA76]MCJ9728864.1 LysR substrate-binding domain-containing protein [Bradyrhizobium sp. PRIMUS42]